ncbi:SWIM zinc finger family protein [Streptomyces smyrnaeus]|uniref:SWIM zinc finger family protein n=1 Tax=Streptomyces smyrnaeus TaxID=1387713 RepID=A0ABS3XRV5_9ACTN|nr:SWIM zinc finger family protein [Streptomyces smyrnaeus]MBO8198132.1 SWIM zinc finger family protein [Streptomyces smyrnaeus]
MSGGVPALEGATGRPQASGAESVGSAWLRAMEGAARDTARLERGRAYARAGWGSSGAGAGRGGVSAVRCGPGRVTAYVHGSRPRPYRAEWRLPVLSAQEWDTFLAAVAARPVAAAALLDGEIPPGVVAVARSVGVRLLPDAGELVPACSCPDQGHPCKHAAALGYETGRLLEADPWALLLVRGRGADAVREEVARRSAGQAGAVPAAPAGSSGVPDAPEEGRPEPAVGSAPPHGRSGEKVAALLPERQQPPSTVPAAKVFATSVRPPLPEPLPLPDVAAESVVYPDLPGAPSADALMFLATDAATRARLALAAVPAAQGDGEEGNGGEPGGGEGSGGEGGVDPLSELSLWHDTIRLAATHPQLTGRRTLSSLFAGLARSAGRDALELARAAAAWRQGGPAGLVVLEADWDPPAGDFDRGRSALASLGIVMTIHRNHLTHAARPVQLRYGRDGRWYPYRAGPEEAGQPDAPDWWPEGPSAADPVQALTGLREH